MLKKKIITTGKRGSARLRSIMIKASQVVKFKGLCPENQYIAQIIHSDFKSLLPEPILDVGAGIGDIASQALHDRQVIQLDSLDYESRTVLLLGAHRRVKGDFFTVPIDEIGPVGSVLLIHVLQFLDSDFDLLKERLSEFKPKVILTVTNRNTGVLGKIVDWVVKNIQGSNPEIDLNLGLEGYSLEKEKKFSAFIRSQTKLEMVRQVEYLMDCRFQKEDRNAVTSILEQERASTELPVDQVIRLYRIK